VDTPSTLTLPSDITSFTRFLPGYIIKIALRGDTVGFVDFKEIPTAKGGQEGQDDWALFTREFFAALHIDVEEGPDRGPDSGRDLLITETRKGIFGSGRHKWLVSCKHYAHSSKAVPNGEEPDILGRVRKFQADGFIGFYSTIPSSELARTLKSCKSQINVIIYDPALIERNLLNNPDLNGVFERFFPQSYGEYKKASLVPHEISESAVGLFCNVCGKDLLIEREGRIGFAVEYTADGKKAHYVDIYWACIGKCDRTMEVAFEKRGFTTSWEGIEDLIIPLVFMQWVITFMNSLRSGFIVFSDEAYKKFIELTFAVAQLVVRETSDEEMERIQSLREMPQILGGLGEFGRF